MKLDETWKNSLGQKLAFFPPLLIGRYEKCFSGVVESPIELKFLISFWVFAMLAELDAWFLYPDTVPAILEAKSKEHAWCITPQFRWGNYRSDFCLMGKVLARPLLIECDGHDFHERTKQQAERDRSKDAEAQIAGFSILRFTGSQIHNDPLSCLQRVIQISKSVSKAA